MRPDDYLEFNYETVTICMNKTRQLLITHELVKGSWVYRVRMGRRGDIQDMEEDGVLRQWVVGPVTLNVIDNAFTYYGAALKAARLVCGWVWDAASPDDE